MELKLKDQISVAPGSADGFGRCQRCGAVVGSGVTVCLACRQRPAIDRAAPPRSGARRLAVLVALALSGGALWMRARMSEPDAGEAMPPPAHAASEAMPPPAPAAVPPAAPAEVPVRTAAGAVPRSDHPASAPLLTETTLTCPVCKGLGRIVDAAADDTYCCPVCGGSRTRTRRYRAGVWQPCPACEGMGACAVRGDLFRSRNRLTRQTCRTCGGRGLVLIP